MDLTDESNKDLEAPVVDFRSKDYYEPDQVWKCYMMLYDLNKI